MNVRKANLNGAVILLLLASLCLILFFRFSGWLYSHGFLVGTLATVAAIFLVCCWLNAVSLLVKHKPGYGNTAAVATRRRPPTANAQVRPLVRQPSHTRDSLILGLHAANKPKILLQRQRGFLSATVAVQMPQVRETLWFAERRLKRYCLAFPYCVFVLGFFGDQLGKIYIYYSSRQPGIADRLSLSNLPNVYGDDSVCMGHGDDLQNVMGRVERLPADMKIEGAINEFWGSSFQWGGYIGEAPRVMPELSNLEKWAKSSRLNPEFILKLNWRRGPDVHAAVERYLAVQDGRVVNY